MHNRGGLISYNGTTLRLKKGYTYNVCVSGMVNAMTNDNSGNYSVRMTDGYDDDYCRYITLIEQDGRGSNSLCFNRIYDLTGARNDVELKFSLEHPGEWGNQKQLCTVCGHVMGTDTKAPVLEVFEERRELHRRGYPRWKSRRVHLHRERPGAEW